MRDSFDLWDSGIKRQMLPSVRDSYPITHVLKVNLASGTGRDRSATHYRRKKESAKSNVYAIGRFNEGHNY